MELTPRLRTLILEAVKVNGLRDPSEPLLYIEERLTFQEGDVVGAFFTWVHAELDKRRFGRANLDDRWAEFLLTQGITEQDTARMTLQRILGELGNLPSLGTTKADEAVDNARSWLATALEATQQP